MTEYKPARFRRLIAYCIDLALSFLIVLPLTRVADILPTGVMTFLVLFCVFGVFAMLLGRDYVFCGRSIGKRILGLAVVERRFGTPAAGRQLLLKNLFFFIYPVDLGFLLFSGRSLGERATGTAVIRSREAAPLVEKKRLLRVIAVLTVLAGVFCLILSIAMAAIEKTEGYQMAYSHLVSSEAFAQSGAEEDDIELSNFASRSSTDADGTLTGTAVYTFRIGSDWYEVGFHPDENGEWQICGDCTNFE